MAMVCGARTILWHDDTTLGGEGLLLGDKIKSARKALGLTQAELAGTLLSRSMISELERNERNPSSETIAILAERLNKPQEFFQVDKRKSDRDQAELLLNQAFACMELGDDRGLRDILTALKGQHTLTDSIKARFHELMAWHEQQEGRPLSAVNHSLLAEVLYEALHRPERQWYCCYLAAYATYKAGLYQQTIEMCNRAINILAVIPEQTEGRRLTIYLLGSAYFAHGKIAAADKCYAESAACEGSADQEDVIRAYHGRAICAQQLGDIDGALRWSKKAAEHLEQKRDATLHAAVLTTWGSALIRMGNSAGAFELLGQIDSIPHAPALISHTARREYLLFLAEQEPYPEQMCRELEHYLASSKDAPASDYETTKTEWAIAKSQLRRALLPDILPAIQHLRQRFQELSHFGRAAEVLEFGASLMERHSDYQEAYRLLKAAQELKRCDH